MPTGYGTVRRGSLHLNFFLHSLTDAFTTYCMATADYLRIADLLIVIIISEGSGPKLFELS